ncbi:uncharacterized protein LOC144456190 [Phascolarctos cinereus]
MSKRQLAMKSANAPRLTGAVCLAARSPPGGYWVDIWGQPSRAEGKGAASPYRERRISGCQKEKRVLDLMKWPNLAQRKEPRHVGRKPEKIRLGKSVPSCQGPKLAWILESDLPWGK